MIHTNYQMLSDVIKQTDKICLAAVNIRGDALQYVKNQAQEICIAAMDEDTEALHFVDETIFD